MASLSDSLLSASEAYMTSRKALEDWSARLDSLGCAADDLAREVLQTLDAVAKPDSSVPDGPLAEAYTAAQQGCASARTGIYDYAAALQDTAGAARAEARTVGGLAEALPVVTLPACPQCESVACPSVAEPLPSLAEMVTWEAEQAAAAEKVVDELLKDALEREEVVATAAQAEDAGAALDVPPDGVKGIVEEVDAGAVDLARHVTTDSLTLPYGDSQMADDLIEKLDQLADAEEDARRTATAALPPEEDAPAPPLAPALEVPAPVGKCAPAAQAPQPQVEVEAPGRKPRARSRGRKGGA
jgi:hypothetical protein